MIDFLSFFCTISLVAVSIIVCVLFSMGVEMILTKQRGWYVLFLICFAIILIQTFLYSWLPGRLGMEITLLDGAITMEDGAIAHNLGYILIAHAVGIILAVLKYIWSCIRKKSRFFVKYFLLEILIAGIFIAISVFLLNNDYTVDYGTDDSVAKPVMYILCAVGVGIIIWAICAGKGDKKKTAEATDPSASSADKSASSSSSTSGAVPNADAIKRFDEVVAEKKRLDQTGDYTGQIILLTEALGLPVDGPRKARLWNYLGMANEQIGSLERSEECYKNALMADPDNPSALNNLALISSDKGDHAAARTYMERALRNAQARNLDMGVVYGNYALVVGLGGDKVEAERLLAIAKNAGYSQADIATVRSRIGL